jgi:tetratricopeptide (TPR) repeat protein
MSSFAKRVVIALLLIPGQTTFTTAAAPTKEQIKQAIEELSGDNFQVRQRASTFLRGAGRAAESYLLEARTGAGLEVAQRIDAILKDFKWGIYPDTPKNVLDQINRYRGGDNNVKRQVMAELLRLGGPGFAALLKIAGAEENVNLRTDVFQLVAGEINTALPALLVEGRYELVEEILERSLASSEEAAARHYAAFLLLRGRLDPKIAHFQKRVGVREEINTALVLAHLYRAKGDLAAARAAAEKSANARVIRQVMLEQRDWSALAKPEMVKDETTEGLAQRAAFQRLAGDHTAFEKTIARLRDPKAIGADVPLEVRTAAKGLFLNDRPGDAVALLIQKKQYLPAFEVLAAQMRYREAFDLLDLVNQDDSHPPLTVDLRRAQFLYQLGERDKAEAILAKSAETLGKELGGYTGYRQLIRTEQRLGRTEQAFAHGATAMIKFFDDDRVNELFDLFFPEHGGAAADWWSFFRKKYESEKGTDTMQRIREIFEKRQTPKNFAELVRDLDRSLDQEDAGRRSAYRAIAGAAKVLGDADLELAYLKRLETLTDKPVLFLRWGDIHVSRKQYREAAAQYQKAWELDKTQPLPLYLRGLALIESGQADEGKKLMELAHLTPLANEETRFGFARALAERGHAEAARRERDLLVRIGPPQNWEMNETLRLVGYEAMRRRDYAAAALLLERFGLQCLAADTSFVDYGALVHVPAVIQQNRALALAAAGKFAEARTVAEQALASTPGNLNVPIQLAAILDEAGRKADADALFARVFQVYRKLATDYPRSGMVHNSLAWLCAACRRELDEGLTHATKATELEPQSAGYLDTLAEIQFQRGDKAKAVELMTRCRELEPTNAYFKKQLQRFEAGDPKAKLPDVG